MEIIKSILTEDVEVIIINGFRQQCVEEINIVTPDPISFEARIDGKAVGYVVVHIICEQLYVKYLFVNKENRSSGIGTKLLQEALDFGREHECTFVYLETFSFQAPKFYQNLGFNVDFVRDGYAKNSSYYYLSKKL